MNKLVSKNSILRFKLGRKIVKAKGGIWSKIWDAITDTDLAYIDNPSVMTAAGHTAKVSKVHEPTTAERLLGRNLYRIGEAGAAVVGGGALSSIRNTSSAGRAISTTKNARNVSNVSLGLRALPGRVSTSNVPAVRSNIRPNTIIAEGRTISSRVLPSRSSMIGRTIVGTGAAAVGLGSMFGANNGETSTEFSKYPIGGIVTTDENGNLVTRRPGSTYIPPVDEKNKNIPEKLIVNTPKYHWVKGFRNRVQGLGLKNRDDVIAMLKKLGVKADGIWGKNTENAYKSKFGFTIDSLTPVNINDEAEELNRKAKPITVNPITTLLNEFALDKQTNYPSMSRSTAQELFDKIILRDEFKTPYNPNFNWKNAPKLSYYPKLNYYYAKQGIKLIPRKKYFK